MQFITLVALTLVATASVHGAPIHKRIAQVISDSTTKWEAACVSSCRCLGSSYLMMSSQDAAGGGTQCNQVAVASFGTLLAAPGPCEQQDAADNMVDLAKTLSNNADMITFAQIFAQQPRNSVRIFQVRFLHQHLQNFMHTAYIAERALLPVSSAQC